jgi:hypothetical protein
MMTNQEIFSKAYLHAKSMKAIAADEDGRCMYRSPNGEKCLMGSFIPDDKYDPVMERLNIRQLITTTSFYRSIFIEIGLTDEKSSNVDFLRELQYCHDRDETDSVEELLKRLKDFATVNRFIIPE